MTDAGNKTPDGGPCIAVMQPYLFPYLGYFQLAQKVDRFLMLDDVNFIKGGWINRNRLLNSGKPRWMTLALSNGSPNRLINEIEISDGTDWRQRVSNLFDAAYRDAPHRDTARPLLDEILKTTKPQLSDLLNRSIRSVCNVLGIDAKIESTTAKYPKKGMKGQDRILDLCQTLGAAAYVNLPGGRELYDHAAFEKLGVKLRFLEPELRKYDQGGQAWTPGMSILDVMAWNEPEKVRDMVQLGTVTA